LSFFKSAKVGHYLCAGDIVGYGPDPNECVNITRKLSPLTICVGNHDRAACGLKEHFWFHEHARFALAWTSRVLTQENQIYLSELPKSAVFSEFLLVHGSPRDPVDEYLMMRRQYEENIPHMKNDVTIVGHTHVPLIFGRDSIRALSAGERIVFEQGKKYIVNPGAVGQPRDGDSRASCALFEPETGYFELHRIEYDILKTQLKMRELKLPPYLIERLSWGR